MASGGITTAVGDAVGNKKPWMGMSIKYNSGNETMESELSDQDLYQNQTNDTTTPMVAKKGKTKPINSTTTQNASTSDLINVRKGDLIKQNADVIVLTTSSLTLMNLIFKQAGDTVKTEFETEIRQNKGAFLISTSSGQLSCKKIYFVSWIPNKNVTILAQSISKLVSIAIRKAIHEQWQSIAFPAIGCGEYGCATDVVAETMVTGAHDQLKLLNTNLVISFIVQPDRDNIYEEFHKNIRLLENNHSTDNVQTKIEANVAKGTIEVVDVIVGCSSSASLKRYIVKAAGVTIEESYNNEIKSNPNALLISTPPGNLSCKRIFFVSWTPYTDETILRQSIIDFMSNSIQNAIAHNFKSIAFPAIGCGDYNCSIDIVVKTMVKEAKNQLTIRNVPLQILFIIQPNKQNIYDEFCKQVVSAESKSEDPPLNQITDSIIIKSQ
ncbi:unnamed protein product [Didymodactylos carnosus]|uniref:Macro domain-containing protein n=1 Tax=Didymodactylos carnosus TaxID=1234261 RepID=A0A8S2PPD1_9BILA|nr:unnamed protein product [Didymodactylos carnosus]CAF4063182.1 unnamed protein product [Didymodactylos carnosus]